jgi:hypothetical protein
MLECLAAPMHRRREVNAVGFSASRNMLNDPAIIQADEIPAQFLLVRGMKMFKWRKHRVNEHAGHASIKHHPVGLHILLEEFDGTFSR